MNRVKIGVIGVGKLGIFHLQNLMQILNAEIIGVHDIDFNHGTKMASEYDIEYFKNCTDLLERVDAVTIAVPTISHFEVGLLAMQHGKAAFIEKPIAATIREAKQMVEYSSKNLIPLQIGHIERFNPAFRCLVLEETNPMFIEAHRLASFDLRGSDVAVVLDLMIHDIDLVLTIVNSPIKRIDANGVSVISDSEDIANARIQFENGCVANLTASRISLKKMRKMRLFQQNSYISMDFLIGLTEVYALKELPQNMAATTPIPWGVIEKDGYRKQITYEKKKDEEKNALKAELIAFVDAIQKGNKPIVTGEDGLRALEIADQILQQIKINNHKNSYPVL
ncbi:Gfo/Idh/MocA family oxidoreductase [candidate division KSB1 bacterium]|nr:Gfo/Idh/MocA family oxidoreductase [candidate division KSB1 bacterium]